MTDTTTVTTTTDTATVENKERKYVFQKGLRPPCRFEADQRTDIPRMHLDFEKYFAWFKIPHDMKMVEGKLTGKIIMWIGTTEEGDPEKHYAKFLKESGGEHYRVRVDGEPLKNMPSHVSPYFKRYTDVCVNVSESCMYVYSPGKICTLRRLTAQYHNSSNLDGIVDIMLKFAERLLKNGDG